MTRENWTSKKMDYMERMYGQHIAEFEGFDDDRRVYIKTYNQIMKALKSLPNDVDSYVAVAMNMLIKTDRDAMDKIIAKFCLDD